MNRTLILSLTGICNETDHPKFLNGTSLNIQGRRGFHGLLLELRYQERGSGTSMRTVRRALIRSSIWKDETRGRDVLRSALLLGRNCYRGHCDLLWVGIASTAAVWNSPRNLAFHPLIHRNTDDRWGNCERPQKKRICQVVTGSAVEA